MNAIRTTLPLLIPFALAACQQQQQAGAPVIAPAAAATTAVTNDSDLLAQGEYLVKVGGCNDCHTPGYPEVGGQIPKGQWLVGSPLGWNGPWGTTYATNLRMKVSGLDEAAWLKYSGDLHTRPPMPDFQLRAMKEQDRLAIYRFIRSLGPAGDAAPTYLPPDQAPKAPYVQWVLPAAPAAAGSANEG
jgi:mono/diheme cytochrome c family protein